MRLLLIISILFLGCSVNDIPEIVFHQNHEATEIFVWYHDEEYGEFKKGIVLEFPPLEDSPYISSFIIEKGTILRLLED